MRSLGTWQLGDHDLCQFSRKAVRVLRAHGQERSRFLEHDGTVIYGLYGFTHGWARILTVMCPAGSIAADEHIDAGEGVERIGGKRRLTQYMEKREGALARMVEANGIIVLDKPEWDAKKRELGDRIW